MADETKNNAPAESKGTDAAGADAAAPKTYSEEDYAALQSQLADAQKQLSDATTTIQSYKDMDIEGIQKSAAEWEQKAKQLEVEQKAKDYSDKLEKYVQAQGMKNDIYAAHLKGQLMAAELKFDKDGTLIGGEDIVKKLRESCPDAFTDDKPKPQFVGSTPGADHKETEEASIRRIMGLK